MFYHCPFSTYPYKEDILSHKNHNFSSYFQKMVIKNGRFKGSWVIMATKKTLMMMKIVMKMVNDIKTLDNISNGVANDIS